ncbi:hypothetical protein Tco_1356194 [Tanacetum coccineum]
MSIPKFAETHNLIAFLEKPEESNGFEEIIDFLNTSSVQYALTVNPIIYTTCIEQFWTSAKAKTVNEERQIQSLLDKNKVIITEISIRSDLKLDAIEGTYCLPTATIFAELERMVLRLHPGMNLVALWHLLSYVLPLTKISTSPIFRDKQVKGMSRHKGIYVITSHTKKVFANMKRPGKGFSGKVTPLFETMMVQATEDMVLALETTKSNQALEIKSLKRRVKSLEKSRKSIILGFKRLRKVGSVSRIESSNYVSLGAQEDASKQGRKTADLDADAEVTLVDKTQEMNNDNLMFDTGVLEKQEKEVAKKEVSVADPVTTAGEVVTTDNVEVTTANAPTTTIDELTLAQTLIEIKASKSKAVTSAATTTTTTRPKAKGVVVQELSEFKTTSSPLQASQLLQAKEKGKAKLVEPEKPLKKKDQITMDEEVARNHEAQLQDELEEEERISRLKEEKANIALLES